MSSHEATFLQIQRTFKAPVSTVFAAWIDPEKVCRWMGPTDATVCRVNEMSVEVGGRYEITMTGSNGGESSVSGTYLEIVPNEKLTFTWIWAHAPEHETLVTVEFKSVDETTAMKLTHSGHVNSESRDAHVRGWTGSLEKFERLLPHGREAHRP